MTDAQKFTMIDGHTYIIDGKPIYFHPDPYDMSDPEAKTRILGFASTLFEGGTLPRAYGKTTVCTLLHDKAGNGDMAMGQAPLEAMPEGIRNKIKEIMQWR